MPYSRFPRRRLAGRRMPRPVKGAQVLLRALEDARLLAELQESPLDNRALDIDDGLAADEQESRILADAVLVQPVRLAQQALDAVARDGTAELLAGGKANAPAHPVRREYIQHEVAVRKGTATPVDTLEITAALDDPSSR